MLPGGEGSLKVTTPQVQGQQVQQILKGQHVQPVTAANFAMSIGAVQGGIVNIAPPGQRAHDRIRPRAQPPRILPRTVPGFLDRDHELAEVGEALARGHVVDLNGSDGVGKTALISQAMRMQLPGRYPDGLVYIRGHHEVPEDTLQEIFEAFFEADDRGSGARLPSSTKLRCSLISLSSFSIIPSYPRMTTMYQWPLSGWDEVRSIS